MGLSSEQVGLRPGQRPLRRAVLFLTWGGIFCNPIRVLTQILSFVILEKNTCFVIFLKNKSLYFASSTALEQFTHGDRAPGLLSGLPSDQALVQRRVLAGCFEVTSLIPKHLFLFFYPKKRVVLNVTTVNPNSALKSDHRPDSGWVLSSSLWGVGWGSVSLWFQPVNWVLVIFFFLTFLLCLVTVSFLSQDAMCWSCWESMRFVLGLYI